MQGKKAIFLFLALLLPVGIFIFLKLFGKNEFAVPAFYQDKAPVTDCQFEYKVPYQVADSVMRLLSSEMGANLYLLHFSELSPRIKQEINENEVRMIDPTGIWDESQRAHLRKCILAVPNAEDLILVDKDRKIRGYYTSTDREEVDRLLMELEILLKKY